MGALLVSAITASADNYTGYEGKKVTYDNIVTMFREQVICVMNIATFT